MHVTTPPLRHWDPNKGFVKDIIILFEVLSTGWDLQCGIKRSGTTTTPHNLLCDSPKRCILLLLCLCVWVSTGQLRLCVYHRTLKDLETLPSLGKNTNRPSHTDPLNTQMAFEKPWLRGMKYSGKQRRFKYITAEQNVHMRHEHFGVCPQRLIILLNTLI